MSDLDIVRRLRSFLSINHVKINLTEDNEIHNCAEHEANCSRLRCQYGIQRARLPDGCDQCSCVQVEIDCEPLKQDCARLNCTYGIERIIGADGCER